MSLLHSRVWILVLNSHFGVWILIVVVDVVVLTFVGSRCYYYSYFGKLMVLLLLLNIEVPFHLPLPTRLSSSDYKFILASQVFGFEQITFTFRSFSYTSLQI